MRADGVVVGTAMGGWAGRMAAKDTTRAGRAEAVRAVETDDPEGMAADKAAGWAGIAAEAEAVTMEVPAAARPRERCEPSLGRWHLP